jgi:hypothetical protein
MIATSHGRRRSWKDSPKAKRIAATIALLLIAMFAVIRVRLEVARMSRDLALFNLAIDSKLRACALVKLRIDEIYSDAKVRDRATVVQKKTGRPVQFEITEQTTASLEFWLRRIRATHLQPFSATYKIALITVRFLWETLPRWRQILLDATELFGIDFHADTISVSVNRAPGWLPLRFGRRLLCRSFLRRFLAGDRHEHFLLTAGVAFLAGLESFAASAPPMLLRSASIKSTTFSPRDRSFAVMGLPARGWLMW